MLGYAVFSVLISCLVLPIIYVISSIFVKWIQFFGIYWIPVISRGNESQSEGDQDALLRNHGYELGDKIGQGTYADVKKAYSIHNKKHVAVKIVNKIEVKFKKSKIRK